MTQHGYVRQPLRAAPARLQNRSQLHRKILTIVAACCLAVAPHAWAGAPTSSENPASMCETAGLAVEQANGLPSGLLLAIGRVESGRWDDARSRITAWPWTINAAGKGLWFASKDAAAQATRDLLNRGVRSIDVGCFQINLLWHPLAFASLAQAFDPDANAAYAARFLLELYGQTGSWKGAVEAYHSADPALGFVYRQQVYSTWAAAPAVPARRPAELGAARSLDVPEVIAGVQVWTPMPVGTASGIVVMPGSPVQPAALTGDAPPLPAVTYRALPPGILNARSRLRTARLAAAAVTPHR